MKWEIWGREDDDGPTFTLFPVGSKMAGEVTEQGERKYTEFETSEEPLPDGLGPSGDPREAEHHFRVAALMSLMYHEGLADGKASPHRACAIHAGQMHGAEAEELRKGIEEILRPVAVRLSQRDEETQDMVDALRRLLDMVDARDSLAYRETLEGKIRGYTRFMQRKGSETT